MPVAEPSVEEADNKKNAGSGNASNDGANKNQSNDKTTSINKTGPAKVKVSSGKDTAVTLLTYEQLDEIASEIAGALNITNPSNSLIVTTSQELTQEIHAYKGTIQRIKHVISQCNQILKNSRNAGESSPSKIQESVGLKDRIQSLTDILTAVSSLFELFKTTTSITQVELNLDSDALAASVIRTIKVKNQKLNVYYQPLMTQTNGKFFDLINDLNISRTLMANKLKQIKANSAKGYTDNDLNSLAALIKLCDSIIEQVSGLDSIALAKLLRVEALLQVIGSSGQQVGDNDKSALILVLKPILGGGDRIENAKSFFHRTDTHVFGCAVVTYMLVNLSGKVYSSGSVQKHSGYKHYNQFISYSPVVQSPIWLQR